MCPSLPYRFHPGPRYECRHYAALHCPVTQQNSMSGYGVETVAWDYLLDLLRMEEKWEEV
jgi:hypothetical protein